MPTEPGLSCPHPHSPASLQAQPHRALLVGPGRKRVKATLSLSPRPSYLLQSQAVQTPVQTSSTQVSAGQGLTGLPS